MATKDQLYQIIAAYGLGRVLPAGSTRAAARTAVNGLVKAGRVVVPRVAPPVAAGALGVGRAAGQAGVERALGQYKAELERDMKLMGCTKISELSRKNLRFRR